MYGRPNKQPDWLDHPVLEWIMSAFRYMWPVIKFLGGALILIVAWSMNPIFGAVVTAAMIYLGIHFRAVSDISQR